MSNSSVKHPFSFPKHLRLLLKKDFYNVCKYGEFRTGNFMVIRIRKLNFSSPTKLGITISRRFGKAHKRNRFKRIIRESFRLAQSEIPPCLHINVSPRKKIEKIPFGPIQKEFISLLR